jgi:hypothetical protein
VDKRYQSFACRDVKSTIYYYEFATVEDLQRHLKGIKAVLWGESGPTDLHPELVLDMSNLLVVISSRRPEFFSTVLSHRVEFPDLTDRVIEARERALRCGKDESAPAEICSALADFKQGAYPAAAGDEAVLVGRSWEVNQDSTIARVGYEALYLDRTRAGQVAAFGGVDPEDDDERGQITAQIEAQKQRKAAGKAGELLDFIRQSYGKDAARARKAGDRSLAFLGLGVRAYVRLRDTRLILITDSMFNAEAPYLVAVYEAGSAPAPGK